MSWGKGILASAIFLIGAGAGIAAYLFVHSLYQPTREVLASAPSPDGSFDCVVERFDPPDLGPGSDDIPWRVLKVFPTNSYSAEPDGKSASFVMHETLSGGYEIAGKSNQIQWKGTKAIVLFDNEPWFEFDSLGSSGWQDVPATTQVTATTKSSKT
jgi:hypothetical protein